MAILDSFHGQLLPFALSLIVASSGMMSCSSDSRAPDDQPRDSVARTAPVDSAVPPVAADTLKAPEWAETGSRADAPPATPADTSVQWIMSDSGAGGVTIGMTRSEVEKVLNLRLEGGDTVSPCIFLRSVKLPQGVSFIFTKGTLARINADFRTVATTAGARVGDSKQRIMSLYPGQVKVTPHEYLEGEYLTIRPKGSKLAYVFETEKDVVIRYRFGRFPEVEWVEGCS